MHFVFMDIFILLQNSLYWATLFARNRYLAYGHSSRKKNVLIHIVSIRHIRTQELKDAGACFSTSQIFCCLWVSDWPWRIRLHYLSSSICVYLLEESVQPTLSFLWNAFRHGCVALCQPMPCTFSKTQDINVGEVLPRKGEAMCS